MKKKRNSANNQNFFDLKKTTTQLPLKATFVSFQHSNFIVNNFKKY